MKDPFKVPPPPPPQMIPQGYPLWLVTSDPDRQRPLIGRELVVGWVVTSGPGGVFWDPVVTHEGGFAVVDRTEKNPNNRVFTTVPPEGGWPGGWASHDPTSGLETKGGRKAP